VIHSPAAAWLVRLLADLEERRLRVEAAGLEWEPILGRAKVLVDRHRYGDELGLPEAVDRVVGEALGEASP
jgi:hypothetical protein